jgi:hypothetical protein
MRAPRIIQVVAVGLFAVMRPCVGQDMTFARADSNVDGNVDIGDAVYTLFHLFQSPGSQLFCEDAADSNDDGRLDITDPVHTLYFLFLAGTAPPPPLWTPGCDPTNDTLSCASYPGGLPCGSGGALCFDHIHADLEGISPSLVEKAKATLRLYYGHTSHGGQIISGLEAMQDDLFRIHRSTDVVPGSLSIFEPGGDLGQPDTVTWARRTREWLDRSENDRNLVIWSWCGQVSWIPEDTLRTDYLENMAALEADYPHVTFVYMTGHLDGSGSEGNLHQRNEQIRAFCRDGQRVLFDFADIESYDPDGEFFLDRGATDSCDYKDGWEVRNWAEEWCERNPGECIEYSCQHSHPLNCDRKARVFWWMLVRLAAREET